MRRIGAFYEDLCAKYIEGYGARIIARNFRCRQGEIDLIAEEYAGGRVTIVFYEVKYRADRRHGYPEEALTTRKKETIRQVAMFFLIRYKLPEDTPCRFDVLACEGEAIRHWKNAF